MMGSYYIWGNLNARYSTKTACRRGREAAAHIGQSDFRGSGRHLQHGTLAGADMEKLELHGSGRSVEVMNMETAVCYAKDANPLIRSFGSWDTVWKRSGFEGAVEHFLHSLGNPSSCGIRADLVLDTHLLVEKLVI